MSFSVGIVGLPNAGKSTLFKALTKNPVDIAPYPFTTINPNIGIVAVPDERLKKIAEVIKPQKITPTIIEFVDIAGLIKNAHKGEGLGNQFLAQIRNCDAILEVVRDFEAAEVEHIGGEISPRGDIEIIKTELAMKDLETLENALKKLEKEVKAKDKNALKKFGPLEKIKAALSRGKLISEIELTDEEKLEIKEYQFLTEKPILYILNTNGKPSSIGKCSTPGDEHLRMNLKDEEGISELSEAEAKELGMKSQLDLIILACYNALNLVTFYTVAGGKETRAWTIPKNSTASRAGGRVHSDFEEKLIRAEVIPWEKLVEAGGWNKARESGWLQLVGKDYIIQDGEVIEFKI